MPQRPPKAPPRQLSRPLVPRRRGPAPAARRRSTGDVRHQYDREGHRYEDGHDPGRGRPAVRPGAPAGRHGRVAERAGSRLPSLGAQCERRGCDGRLQRLVRERGRTWQRRQRVLVWLRRGRSQPETNTSSSSPTAPTRLYRIDPYAYRVTSSVGNGIVYDHAAFDWQGDSFGCPAHNELVIYELHVGSFAPSDEGDAGTSRTSGKLEHFAASRRQRHRADAGRRVRRRLLVGLQPRADPFAVESGYGGPDALKALVKAAHEHGIAVILDVVYNHFGPSDLDLWQFDGWSEDGKGGIYFYNDGARRPRGATPAPTTAASEVRPFIRDNALMWLRGVPRRRPALRHDALHAHRATAGTRRPAGGLEPHARG